MVNFLAIYFEAMISFSIAAIIFSMLEFIPDLKCNIQDGWWKNKSIRIDLLYFFMRPIFYVVLRYIPIIFICVVLLIFFPINQIYAYLIGGLGPLSRLSPLSQAILYFILSDLLMYWMHRIFHTNILWSIHIIHHSPIEVDWTTSYRFHPLNLALGPWLVTTLLLFLGISPKNIFWVAYIESVMSYFVHANLNITLGPLKYIFATPVFHRWHHTFTTEGGASNYGAVLACWDVLFGTFYFPVGQVPQRYGIENDPLNKNIFKQLFHPFIIFGKVLSRARDRAHLDIF